MVSNENRHPYRIDWNGIYYHHCVIDAYTPLVYPAHVIFIESAIFTKQVKELLPDDVYAQFQVHLALRPTAAPKIQGTGGLRKVRWHAVDTGKSGGVRVIYFYAPAVSQIRLLLIYSKGVKDDLTDAEKKVLRKINENW